MLKNTKDLFVFLLLVFSNFIAHAVGLSQLKTEYTKTPIGIGVEKPCFSWIMSVERKGANQKAYQLIVINEKGEIVWDSKKRSVIFP